MNERSRCPYYRVLGINEDASEEEIRRAYFEKLREFPPNIYPDKYREISRAYETLIDPARRRLCDILGDIEGMKLKEIINRITGRRIAEIGVDRINVGGQEINIKNLVCEFCNERISDPYKPIVLEVRIKGSNFAEPVASFNICPDCYNRFKEANKNLLIFKNVWNIILVLSLINLTVMSIIVFFSSLIGLFIYNNYSKKFGEILNWAAFENIQRTIQNFIDSTWLYMIQYRYIPDYNTIVSKTFFKLKGFSALGSAVHRNSRWTVELFSRFRIIVTIVLAILGFGTILAKSCAILSQ